MSSPTILARKGRLTRRFTQYQWELLGANKHGWIQTSDMSVTNTVGDKTVTTMQKPDSGQKKTISVESDVAKFERLANEAAILMQEGNFAQALITANEALKLNPDSKMVKSAIEEINYQITAKLEREAGENKEEGNENTDEGEAGGITEGLSQEQKDAWIAEHLKDFNKTAIKDYFASINKPVANSLLLPELKTKLAELVEYSSEELKKILE